MVLFFLSLWIGQVITLTYLTLTYQGTIGNTNKQITFVIYLFWGRISCSLWTCYIEENDLALLIYMLPPPWSWITGMCWDTCSMLRWRSRPSHILSKHSAKWTAGSASGPLLIFFILKKTCILTETVLFHLIAIYQPWHFAVGWTLVTGAVCHCALSPEPSLHLPLFQLSVRGHPFRWKA